MSETTSIVLKLIASYLRDHPELALRWQSDVGYWEIIYVTGHIGFEGDAMISVDLETLANKLPKE